MADRALGPASFDQALRRSIARVAVRDASVTLALFDFSAEVGGVSVQALLDGAHATDSVARLGDGLVGVLMPGATPAQAQQLLAPMLDFFRTRYREVRCAVVPITREAGNPALLLSLARHTLDAAAPFSLEAPRRMATGSIAPPFDDLGAAPPDSPCDDED